MNILHLEDNLLDRELVSAMLAAQGIDCEFFYAQTADEFAAALRQHDPDLIISDFSLPGHDGAQALRTAKEMRGDVPFIFFSGTLGEEAAVESLKNGATDYVLKHRPDRLVSAVVRALEEHQEHLRRIRAEAELHRREEFVRQIMDHVKELVTVVDLHGRRLFSSPSHRLIFGPYPPPDGSDFFMDIHIDDRGLVRSAFQEIAAGVGGQLVEYRLRVAGEVRYMEAQGSVIRDAGGGAQWVMWVSRDVTESRLDRERLLEQTALLEEARDAICLQDLNQRILYWNRSAERLYGWPVPDALGRNANDLLADNGVALAALKELISRGEWYGELEQTTRDGRKIIVESRWTLVRDSRGDPKSILVINTDVTEKRQLESQYLRAQRLESIGSLAGGIAHDLNNVLGPIVMASELVLRRTADPQDRELLDTIKASAERGSGLVKQILSFARGAEVKKEPIQLRHLIGEISKLITNTFPRGIEVAVSAPSDLPVVQGDTTQLHQVILNLCVNARDAMPHGGLLTLEAMPVTLRDRTGLVQAEKLSGPCIEIKITDSGMGIPPEALARIFDPFFTTKEPGKGTGLGLATVLAIVKGHGGLIDIVSQQGKGTAFSIFLPVPPSSTAAQPAEVSSEMAAGHGEQILVVDDELALLEIVRSALTFFNYRVITASSGVEALALFAERHAAIDVVITDMMMPGMGGPALVTALRRIRPEIKLVAVSGLETGVASSLGEDGIGAVLHKPFTTKELLTALRGVLD